MSLTLEQLQRMQSFCPDYRMELIGGEVVVLSPSGYESDEVAAEFVRQLGNWVRGRVFCCLMGICDRLMSPL
nr:Uma2 family endonuclease [Spirulina subsalsa]